MFDFHTHSYYSDGTFSPTELVRAAKAAQVQKLALTDHDTTRGLAEAELEAQKQHITFIKGIEVSAFDEELPSIHILGLKLKKSEVLADLELKNQESRRKLTLVILDCLQKFENIKVTYDELMLAFKGTIGNGNLAQYLVHQKYCPNFASADKLVRHYKKGSYGVEIAEAIRFIHEAGGLAFLAHPYSLNLSIDKLTAKIADFKQKGLDGIEYAHSNHTEEQTVQYLQLAKHLDMLLTAGSDFHGAYKPNVHLGTGKGLQPLGDEQLIAW